MVLVALHLGCILLFVGLTLDVEIFFDVLRYVWLHTVYGDKMQLVSHFEGQLLIFLGPIYIMLAACLCALAAQSAACPVLCAQGFAIVENVVL